MNWIKHIRKISYIFFKYYSLAHKVQKKVLFNSFYGRQYSDNPRAICEKLHELYPDYELVWILDNNLSEVVPDYVRIVDRNRLLDWGKEISTAACYVYNIERSSNIFRKNDQLFIQTWHGDRAIKKILKLRDQNMKLYENEVTNLCIAGSEKGKGMFESAFNYRGTILNVGCPRNDCLLTVSPARAAAVKSSLGIPVESKVLLFAPTFRDNRKETLQESAVDISRVLDLMPSGEDWICLVRAHLASAGIAYNKNDDRIYDVTFYPDMADLLYITDFLISDYSSCATDFAITEKPIVLAVFDRYEYTSQCRAFFAVPEEIGFIVAHNQKELEQIISNTARVDYQKACRAVNAYYGTTETGSSSEAVCLYINDFYNAHNVNA